MNIKNLKILRNWLAAGNITQKQFDMRQYRNGGSGLYRMTRDNCGTVGCVLGWCPFIPEFSNYKANFFDYLAEELFDIDYQGNKWHFLFSGEWARYDNTIDGAIARIDIVIAGDFEE